MLVIRKTTCSSSLFTALCEAEIDGVDDILIIVL